MGLGSCPRRQSRRGREQRWPGDLAEEGEHGGRGGRGWGRGEVRGGVGCRPAMPLLAGAVVFLRLRGREGSRRGVELRMGGGGLRPGSGEGTKLGN